MIHFLDTAHFVVLVLLTVLIRAAVQIIRTTNPWNYAARCISALFLLGYCFHLLPQEIHTDIEGLLLAIVRAIVATCLFYFSLAYPVTFLWSQAWKWQEILRYRFRKQEPPVEAAPEPEPVPREELFRQGAKEAKHKYELECDLLKKAGLRKDELRSALIHAKQKYLQRLKQTFEI